MSKIGIFDANGVPVTTDAYDDAGAAEVVITGAGKQGVWFAKPLEPAGSAPTMSAATVTVTPTPAATGNVAGTPVSPTPPIEVVELPVPPPLKELFPFDAAAELPSMATAQLKLGGEASNPVAMPCKVALLHSGGAGSTAMLLHLLGRGCEVHPYFVRIFKSKSLNDHGQMLAERSVRRLRDWGNNVARLTILEAADKRQRVAAITPATPATLVELLQAEVCGEGFNLVAFGQYERPANEDEDVVNLEDLAAEQLIQIYSWADASETNTLEEILTLVDDGAGPFRQLLWDSTTSCTQVDAEVELDCGECTACLRRAEAFVESCGEDRTRYVKKSAARRTARKSRLTEGQDVALTPSMLMPLHVPPEAAVQFPLIVTKVRNDGLYEVGLLRGGKLAAVGAFSRTALVRK